MARVTSTSDSQLSGKVGDKVYVQRYDMTYVRKVPTIKKNSRTPGQLLNQQRFREINRFYKQFKTTIIPRIWNDAAVNNTGYRLFLNAISPAFAKDGTISDYKLLKLTTGKLLLPLEITAQREAADSPIIRVSWQQDLHLGGERLRDELMVISAADGKFSEMTGTGLIRRTCGGTFELPLNPDPAGYIYLFLASTDRRDYSDSVCVEV